MDDASPREAVRATLRALPDPRIRTVLLTASRGVAAATNEALAFAKGDYVVFLDHDGELTIDCFYELTLCVDRDNPDLVYSDEDKIAPDGRWMDPFFKPDRSPDTMMSLMFARQVMCVRRTMLDLAGGLRSEFDGSQDYDLVLRIVEKTDRISHIPMVLYHWRIIASSVAADLTAKLHTGDASRRARAAALQRRGLRGAMEPVPQAPGQFRVNYEIRDAPLISIIIPTKNNGRVLIRCIYSIKGLSSYRNVEIIVMNNGSTDLAAAEALRQLAGEAGVSVISHDHPFNYSEINNVGVRHARGELLVFLNDDTEVLSADWLERMGGYAQLGHVGAVGAKLLYPGTRKVQHVGIVNLKDGPCHAFTNQDADSPGYFMRNILDYNWIAVTGACLMIERKKFDSIGGFDERLPVAYNDVKLCFDLADAGLYVVACSAVELLHHESKSRGGGPVVVCKARTACA